MYLPYSPEMETERIARFLPSDLKAGREAYRREQLVVAGQRVAEMIASIPGGKGFKLYERNNALGNFAEDLMWFTGRRDGINMTTQIIWEHKMGPLR